MKDTTKLGLYFILGIILFVVPITYTLTIIGTNLKNIDTDEIVVAVNKLVNNLGRIDTLNNKISNLTDKVNGINFDEIETILISINHTLASMKVNIGPFVIQSSTPPNPSSLQGQLRL